LLVPAILHQDIQYVPVLIYGPPQIVRLALDPQTHLVEMPLVTGPRAVATELSGIRLSECATLFANRLIGDLYTTFRQEFFHITKTEAEAKVQLHGVADDLHGKTMVLIFWSGGQCVHAATLTHCVGA
jgi:hypothetical protein